MSHLFIYLFILMIRRAFPRMTNQSCHLLGYLGRCVAWGQYLCNGTTNDLPFLHTIIQAHPLSNATVNKINQMEIIENNQSFLWPTKLLL